MKVYCISFILLLSACCVLANTVPGVIIAHSSASRGIYLGSPAIVILPDGNYLAKCDEFGPKSAARAKAITSLYRSQDSGKTWQNAGQLEGLFWATLFVHRGNVYAMGTDKEYGSTVIFKSGDNGKTWSKPKDKNSGLLLDDAKYHTAPVPVVENHNRLWRAMEDAEGPDGWGSHFRAFMMSAPVDADLLRAESWRCSNRLGRDPNWLDHQFGGWLEGNAVVTPGGEVVDILRVDYRMEQEKAAIVHISPDGKIATFDPQRDFIEFPGGCKKFTIRYDTVSKLYWTLSNAILPIHHNENPERTRNAVALMASADLRDWKIRNIVLYHPDVHKHGFQYLDWLFEGEDIIAVSRTAYDDDMGGADNQHNANYLTFHRIRNFRNMEDNIKELFTVPDI